MTELHGELGVCGNDAFSFKVDWIKVDLCRFLFAIFDPIFLCEDSGFNCSTEIKGWQFQII